MTTPADPRTRWERRRTAIRRALIGALRDGQDVAELLVVAAADAERTAARDSRSILDNRPGSWEAALLRDMLQSGGAYDDEAGQ